MILHTVRYAVILCAVALMTVACSMDTKTPEDLWQETYDQGFVFQSNKKWEKAKASYEEALQLARKIDPKGKRAGDTLLSLGEVSIKLKQHDPASDYFIDAQKIFEKLYNPEIGGINNRDLAIKLAKAMYGHTQTLVVQQKNKEAHELIRRARKVAEDAPAPDYLHHDILALEAEINEALGLREESKKLSKGANWFDTPLNRKSKEDIESKNWQDLVAAGDEAVSAMNYENATALYERARKLLEKNNQGGFASGRLYLSMGILADIQKDYEKADRLLTKSWRILRINEEKPKDTNTKYYTSEAMERLAALKLHTGKLDEARSLFEMTIGMERSLQHTDSYRRRERKLMEALEDVYKKQKDYAKAEELRKEQLAIELALYGPKSKKQGYNYRDLGDLAVLTGKTEEAAQYYEKAMNVFEHTPDLNPREKLELYDEYANLLDKSGDREKARKLRNKADELETGIINDFSK